MRPLTNSMVGRPSWWTQRNTAPGMFEVRVRYLRSLSSVALRAPLSSVTSWKASIADTTRPSASSTGAALERMMPPVPLGRLPQRSPRAPTLRGVVGGLDRGHDAALGVQHRGRVGADDAQGSVGTLHAVLHAGARACEGAVEGVIFLWDGLVIRVGDEAPLPVGGEEGVVDALEDAGGLLPCLPFAREGPIALPLRSE